MNGRMGGRVHDSRGGDGHTLWGMVAPLLYSLNDLTRIRLASYVTMLPPSPRDISESIYIILPSYP
jgi:hypothetical protein